MKSTLKNKKEKKFEEFEKMIEGVVNLVLPKIVIVCEMIGESKIAIEKFNSKEFGKLESCEMILEEFKYLLSHEILPSSLILAIESTLQIIQVNLSPFSKLFFFFLIF